MNSPFKGGYLGKLLRINLSDRSSRVESIDVRLMEMLLGGRGIAAKYYYDEIGSEVDPLGMENKLYFFTGPLTGVDLPSTTKFQLATKSPESRGYLCSNCSGNFGPELKKSGLDALIIEGKSDSYVYIVIRDGKVEFRSAEKLKGMHTNAAQDAMKEDLGDGKFAAMSIGPAGEKLVRIAYINVDERAFGRGGGGAVMGSKNLKGIAVRGTGSIPVADPVRVKEIWKAAIRNLKETRANHTKYGTAQYIGPINELGCMPTRNYQTTHFEHGDKVDHLALHDNYRAGNYACFHCSVACGIVAEVKEGPFKGARARTEFENIGLLGPNCGISDFGAIVAANELCDDLGIDTISGANAVSLAMELYEKGLINDRDTKGIKANFGNPEALVGLLRLLGSREGIGDILAEGMLGVIEKHPEWEPFICHVKGLPYAAYDPRGFYGNALTYGTSSRGACHNVGGWTIRDELQSGKYDRFALEGKGALVQTIQDNRAYVDSLGICTVVRGSMSYSADPKGDTLESVTGYPFTGKLLEIGARIYTLERIILNREGRYRESDQMPPRTITEAVPDGPIAGRTLTKEMYNSMLDDYYDIRGWDKNGAPTKETVRKLKLESVLV